MALRKLQDSPILAPLARAAARVNLEIRLFGSVASRALLFDTAKIRVRDLFELVEHVSAIDIVHNGPARMTPQLELAILREVPTASWFRWTIRDREQMAEHNLQENFDIDVPLRRLTLGTRSYENVEWTENLLSRALRGDFEILPNDRFSTPPRAGSVTGAYAGLLYIDVAIDVLEAQIRASLQTFAPPSFPARQLIEDGVSRIIELPQSQRKVAMRRLWYRLASLAARVPPSFFETITDYFGLHGLLRLLVEYGFPVDSFKQGAMQPILISSYVGDEKFRAPLSGRVEDRIGTGSPGEALNDCLISMSSEGSEGDADPFRLGSGNDVIGAVRSISLHSDKAFTSRSSHHLQQDFLHISIPIPNDMQSVTAEQLAAIVIGYNQHGPALLPVFAVASVAKYPSHPWPDRGHKAVGRCTIRLNLAGQTEGFTKIDVYLVREDFQ